MLAEIYIKNLGLVEEMSLSLTPGLIALTGETGAGKSIILGAIDLAMGGRASADMIRTGEERAVVSAVFTSIEKFVPGFLAQGIELEEGTLILNREINRNGRNICRINSQPVSLSQYRELCRALVDMHGQNEQHLLALADRRLELCDLFGGRELIACRDKMKALFEQWQEALHTLAKMRREEESKKKRINELASIIEEIQKLSPGPDEEQQLENERRLLVNGEKVAQVAYAAYEAVYGDGSRTQGIIDLLGGLANNIDVLASYDARLSALLESAREALCRVEDIALELSSYRDALDFDPGRLAVVEERLNQYSRLKRRYDLDSGELLQLAENSGQELAMLQEEQNRLEELEKEAAARERSYLSEAAAASELRKKAAARLELEVTKRLKELEMERVTFKVQFAQGEPSAHGMDSIDFLISPNLGEPLKPLFRIGSGGEISRVMLALKAVLAEVDETPTLIFDEIDAGIGGRALTAVAESLSDIAGLRQVITVTHAAQVASMANLHIHVFKQEEKNRTRTVAKALSEDERVAELARMLGGRDSGGAAREHALALMRKNRV